MITKILGNRILIRRIETAVIGGIVLPDNADRREEPFQARVISVGDKLTEDIKPGDVVWIGPCVSQSKLGSHKDGENELVSTLDVLGIVEGN